MLNKTQVKEFLSAHFVGKVNKFLGPRILFGKLLWSSIDLSGQFLKFSETGLRVGELLQPPLLALLYLQLHALEAGEGLTVRAFLPTEDIFTHFGNQP